jgi:calcium homeostasis endoplasmic reticulum protein
MQQSGLFGSNFNQQPPNFNLQQPPPQAPQSQFNIPPPFVPDMSRPPPNFITNEIPPQLAAPPSPEPEPEPQPYYTLPAGLMIPLIKIEDSNYQPIDSDQVKLPRIQPPTESIIKAIEAFYSAPCHDRPRDLEGWEKLGLYEYFKTKNAFRKQKEEAIARGDRKKSKSPSPIPENFSRPPKKVKKRIYNSKSPEIKDTRSRSKSRSISPERPLPRPRERESRSRKRSRSPPSPHYRNYNRDRKRRSITPPSFLSTPKTTNEFIDEGNKGHQMLKKLGWTSGGLGKKQGGIAEPISGGEVRDRNDMYKVS